MTTSEWVACKMTDEGSSKLGGEEGKKDQKYSGLSLSGGYPQRQCRKSVANGFSW